MGMLDRFADIVKANINDLLDKCEDPAKMIDQYLRDLTENLAEVKQETAGVMAEEARTKRIAGRATPPRSRATTAWRARRSRPATKGTPARFWPRSSSWRPRAKACTATYEAARENAEQDAPDARQAGERHRERSMAAARP